MSTRREIEAADKAKELYSLIGRPGYDRFEKIVNNDEIENCSVNVCDVKRMLIIYGPDVATLKGRMMHQKPSKIPIFEPIVVPEYILKLHGRVHLAAVFLCTRPGVSPYKIEEDRIVDRDLCRKQRETNPA